MSVTKEQVLDALKNASIGPADIEFWNDTLSPLAIRVTEEVIAEHNFISLNLPDIKVVPGSAINIDTNKQLGWVAFTKNTLFGAVVSRVEIPAETWRDIVIATIRISPDDDPILTEKATPISVASNLLDQSILYGIINHAVRFGLGDAGNTKPLRDEIFKRAFRDLPKSEL